MRFIFCDLTLDEAPTRVGGFAPVLYEIWPFGVCSGWFAIYHLLCFSAKFIRSRSSLCSLTERLYLSLSILHSHRFTGFTAQRNDTTNCWEECVLQRCMEAPFCFLRLLYVFFCEHVSPLSYSYWKRIAY